MHFKYMYLTFEVFFSYHFQYLSSHSKEGGFWIAHELHPWGSLTGFALPLSDHNLNQYLTC